MTTATPNDLRTLALELRVARYSIYVCVDCYYAVNGIDTGEEPSAAMYAGAAALPKDTFSGSTEIDFSKSPCDCCSSPLAGSRYELVVFPDGITPPT